MAVMISTLRSKLDEAKGARNSARALLATHQKDLAEKKILLEDTLEGQALLQQTAKETQEALRFHIQDLVQAALDSIFPGVYTFEVEFEIKRGRTEALLQLDKDGEKINPMDATGGGVVDIMSFALRLAAWSLSKTDNVILLDEPFRFVSANLRPLCGEILQGLSQRLGLQIIMVTHDEEMMAIADRQFVVDQKRRQSFAVQH